MKIRQTNRSFHSAPILFSLLFALASLLSLQSSQAALLFYDDFNYTVGQRLGDSSSSADWENAKDQLTIATGSLTYSGLQTSTGNRVNVESTTATLDGVRTVTGAWASQSNGTLYVSFLLRVQSTTGTGTTGDGTSLVTVSRTANNTQLLGINLLNSGGIKLGVLKYPSSSSQVSSAFFASGAGANLSADGSTVYLVVAKYEWVAGTTNDVVTVWVNPGNLGGVEDSGNKVSTSTGTDGTQSAGRFTISRGANFNIDELRIGQTWAEVTPSDGPPVSTPTPVITQALFSPQGMILRGTNGPPSNVYQVIASTNLTIPASNWPSVAAHLFDSSGNFDSTNPVTVGLGQQYFRLLVGGTISPPSTAPSITNQPQSLIVAVGATANFLVGASGTLPLDYFWSFNINTPVGGNSSTLSLINVQTNDSGSYRVVVTNSSGSATSSVATLTVLVPPAITDSPTNLTVTAGSSAVFNVTATGSAPLRYQWYLNTNSSLTGATNATLTLNSVNTTNAGTYSVVVTNGVGAVTSSVATLTVLGPPTITTQPQNQTVTISNNAAFSVVATGTAPLNYQWYFNNNTSLTDKTNASLAINNAQTNDAGGYSVVVNNSYGSTTSVVATLTVNPPVTNNTIYNLYGFGQATTGGGIIAEGSAGWVKVTNALDFAWAISNKNGSVKVIEIMNDLDLGWNEIPAAVQGFSIFSAHDKIPLLHPRLLQTGVSKVDIQQKNGLTIFSANGATIRHVVFNIKNSQNIIVRNLKFDEMWEWDEDSEGNYDRNDWDFITVGDGGGTVVDLWVDHCTFTKSYDGSCDIKGGAHNITFSWNKYAGDDGATNLNSFVWQQINSLESNAPSHAMYNFLRSHGFSTTNIVTIIQGPQKTHLMGANSLDAENNDLSATFHHQWYINPWDRLPRLRGGNVHNYNIYVDDIQALAARRMRDAIAATLTTGDQNTLNNTYNFRPFLNGSISTENGALLVEKSVYIDCLTPLRNNQTDTNNPAYTGKIMALDSIYHFDNTNGTTIDFRGDSTNAPGSTYFGPVQAPIIPFSWNGFSSLPYSYVLDDPSQLQSILTNPNSGAGAGVLTWAKTNWIKTSY